jgi:DNA-binding GntR family transcriptional regulator
MTSAIDPIRPIRPQSTMEETVYEELRELIVSLELPPNTRLTQRGVAERLGVSQTPVRVAMGRLSREGLVANKRGRATVTPLTRELYQEILAARLGPEALIARLGAPLTTDADIDAMDEILDRLRYFAGRRDSRSYVRARWDLHATCYRAAARPRLFVEVRRVFSLVERYSVALPAIPEVTNQSIKFYSDFVDACRDRDAERAERIIINGIEWGWTTLAEYFPSETDPSISD